MEFPLQYEPLPIESVAMNESPEKRDNFQIDELSQVLEERRMLEKALSDAQLKIYALETILGPSLQSTGSPVTALLNELDFLRREKINAERELQHNKLKIDALEAQLAKVLNDFNERERVLLNEIKGLRSDKQSIEKAISDAQLQLYALETLIEVAEQEWKIDIRKRPGYKNRLE